MRPWRHLTDAPSTRPLSHTVQQVLTQGVARLAAAGIADAGLEAQVLAMHAAGWDRATLLSSLGDSFPSAARPRWEEMVERRLHREPLAYIVGHREFYGLEFLVDGRVLIPRQETECLVEQVLDIVREHYHESVTIADIGTGSGAIAIALAAAIPHARVFAVDRSGDALAVAAENIRHHHLERRVSLVSGNLLDPLPAMPDIVVANLPYIPASKWQRLQPEICLFEPKGALLAGEDGLDAIAALVDCVRRRNKRPKWIALEFGVDQAIKVTDMARAAFPLGQARVFRDLQGLERGIVLTGLSS